MTDEERLVQMENLLDDMTERHRNLSRRLAEAQEDRELLRDLAQSLQTQRSWCVVVLAFVAALAIVGHGGPV